MSEIKYYVTFGKWKTDFGGLDDIKKAMEEWAKKVEEAGVKIKFWGSPYGVSESAICVYKGSIEDYSKLAPMDAPFTDSRTHMVLVW